MRRDRLDGRPDRYLDSGPAFAKDDLVIGAIQFPGTFHPSIDAMATKNYILDMARRPFTTYDQDWKLICMLCTELPSLEKGTAVEVTRPDGTRAIDATFKIQPGAAWGDGTPITTKDVLFTWEVGKHPQSGITNSQMFAKDIVGITAVDDKTFVIHWDKFRCSYDFDQRLPAAARASGAPGVRSRSGAVPDAHALRYGQDQSGALFRAVQDHAGGIRRLCGAGTEPDMVGREAELQADRGADDREHLGHGSQPALRRGRFRRGRGRAVDRTGAGVREAQRQALQRRLQAGAVLRAYRPEARQPDPGRTCGSAGRS